MHLLVIVFTLFRKYYQNVHASFRLINQKTNCYYEYALSNKPGQSEDERY